MSSEPPDPYRAPVADLDEQPRLDALLKSGRGLVLAALGVAFVELSVELVLRLSGTAAHRAPLLFALANFLYRGRNWARVALLLWYALGVVSNLWLVMEGAPPLVSALLAMLTVGDAAAFAVLTSSSAVAAFLRHQRG